MNSICHISKSRQLIVYRVDSDRDGKALGSGNTGNTGTHSGSNTDSFGNRNNNV